VSGQPTPPLFPVNLAGVRTSSPRLTFTYAVFTTVLLMSIDCFGYFMKLSDLARERKTHDPFQALYVTLWYQLPFRTRSGRPVFLPSPSLLYADSSYFPGSPSYFPRPSASLFLLFLPFMLASGRALPRASLSLTPPHVEVS